MSHILHIPYGWLDPIVWTLFAIVIIKVILYFKGIPRAIFAFFRTYREDIENRVNEQEKKIKDFHVALHNFNTLLHDVKKEVDKIEESRKTQENNFAKTNDALYKNQQSLLKEKHVKYHNLYQKMFDADMNCKVSNFACEKSLLALKDNFQSQELYNSYFSWSFSTFKSLHSEGSDNMTILQEITR